MATDIGERSFDLRLGEEMTEYKPSAAVMMKGFRRASTHTSPSCLVEELVHTAVTDDSDQLRYLADADAEQLLTKRAKLHDLSFMAMMEG